MAKYNQMHRVFIHSFTFWKRIIFITVVMMDLCSSNKNIDECPTLKLDLVIIVDTSTSVTESNFKISIEFIRNILTPLPIGPESVRVALVRYSTDVYIVSYLKESMRKEEKLKKVSSIQYKLGDTYTHDALKETRQKVLIPRYGDRPDVQDLIILITDGKSQKKADTLNEGSLLKQKTNLKIFTIGVTSLIEEEELRNISSSPDHFLKVISFTDLNSHRDIIKPIVCSGGSRGTVLLSQNNTMVYNETTQTSASPPDTTNLSRKTNPDTPTDASSSPAETPIDASASPPETPIKESTTSTETPIKESTTSTETPTVASALPPGITIVASSSPPETPVFASALPPDTSIVVSELTYDTAIVALSSHPETPIIASSPLPETLIIVPVSHPEIPIVASASPHDTLIITSPSPPEAPIVLSSSPSSLPLLPLVTSLLPTETPINAYMSHFNTSIVATSSLPETPKFALALPLGITINASSSPPETTIIALPSPPETSTIASSSSPDKPIVASSPLPETPIIAPVSHSDTPIDASSSSSSPETPIVASSSPYETPSLSSSSLDRSMLSPKTSTLPLFLPNNSSPSTSSRPLPSTAIVLFLPSPTQTSTTTLPDFLTRRPSAQLLNNDAASANSHRPSLAPSMSASTLSQHANIYPTKVSRLNSQMAPPTEMLTGSSVSVATVMTSSSTAWLQTNSSELETSKSASPDETVFVYLAITAAGLIAVFVAGIFLAFIFRRSQKKTPENQLL